MTDVSSINFTQWVSSTGDQLKTNFQSAWNYTGFSIVDVVAIVFILIVFFWIVNVKIEFVDLDGQSNALFSGTSTGTGTSLKETTKNKESTTRNDGPLITHVPFPKKEYAWWNFLQVDFN